MKIAKVLISAVLLATPAFAGVARFSAKHVVKPVAKHAAHVAKKAAKGAVKAAY